MVESIAIVSLLFLCFAFFAKKQLQRISEKRQAKKSLKELLQLSRKKGCTFEGDYIAFIDDLTIVSGIEFPVQVENFMMSSGTHEFSLTDSDGNKQLVVRGEKELPKINDLFILLIENKILI